MCSLASAAPSDAGCGVWAIFPVGVTRSDSFSSPFLPPCKTRASPELMRAARRPSKTRSMAGVGIGPRILPRRRLSPQMRTHQRRRGNGILASACAVRRGPSGMWRFVMLVGSEVRRVAVVDGVRIPFARAHGAYANVSNQDMLTAVFRGLVDRHHLHGQRLGDAIAGAVI